MTSVYFMILILQMLPAIMIIALIMQQSHFLMSLLALEGLTLSLVLFVPITLTVLSMSAGILSLLMLTLGACEASIGLALLVMMVRSYGNDLVNNTSLNKC
nr:NADH dehydrogenase subunit 4L [Tubifex tubifex]